MLRSAVIGFGITLVLIWIVGMCDDAGPWPTWVDGTTGALALLVAGALWDRVGWTGRALACAALALPPAALFVEGLARHDTPWLTWWNLAFALGAAGLGATAFALPRLDLRRTPRMV